MKILFLGGNQTELLARCLEENNNKVIFIKDKISMVFFKNFSPDWIISYNYRYIISKEIIDFMKGKIINLHISYLPWNRGAYPNVWSIIENTPKGVTIHYIDEGIDTGDILVQKKMELSDNETLKSSYELLHKEIQKLFKENWEKIIKGRLTPIHQDKKEGSIHYKRDLEKIKHLFGDKGWNITIKELKERLSKNPIRSI